MSQKTYTYGAVKENFLLGIIGAFIFSLAGGVAWYILYQLGYIAGLSGIIGVICAIKGYKVFAKKESVKGVVVAVIVSILVIVAAWYLCIATDIAKAYDNWYESGDSWYKLTFMEYIQSAGTFLTKLEFVDGSSISDAESTRAAYFGDLALGLLFCVIGGFASVKDAIKRAKNGDATVAQPVVTTQTAPISDVQTAEIPATPAAEEAVVIVENTAAETEAALAEEAQETVSVELPEMPEVPTVDDIPAVAEVTTEE